MRTAVLDMNRRLLPETGPLQRPLLGSLSGRWAGFARQGGLSHRNDKGSSPASLLMHQQDACQCLGAALQGGGADCAGNHDIL